MYIILEKLYVSQLLPNYSSWILKYISPELMHQWELHTANTELEIIWKLEPLIKI